MEEKTRELLRNLSFSITSLEKISIFYEAFPLNRENVF
jgi:hypothetical protein